MCVLIHYSQDHNPEYHDGEESKEHYKEEEYHGGDGYGEPEKLLRGWKIVFLSPCDRIYPIILILNKY